MRSITGRIQFRTQPNNRALTTRARSWPWVINKRMLAVQKKKKKKRKKERKKNTIWREKSRLTNPKVQTAATSKVWSDPGRTSFSPLHSRRQKRALLGRVPQTWKWSKPRANSTVCYCYRSCAMTFIKINETIGTATKMTETTSKNTQNGWTNLKEIETDRNCGSP